jgi:ISXO2-like transposase domain
MERGGSARSFHVDGVRVGDLQPIIRENLSREARLMTDEMWSYREIGKEFASHETVNHKRDEYVRGDDHQYRRRLLFDLQARHEGRLSALR